jgi:hypothetical protein
METINQRRRRRNAEERARKKAERAAQKQRQWNDKQYFKRLDWELKHRSSLYPKTKAATFYYGSSGSGFTVDGAGVKSNISYRWSSPGADTVTLGASPSDWKVRLFLGQSATSTLAGVKRFAKSDNGTYRYYHSDGKSPQQGHYDGPLAGPDVFPSVSTFLDNAADALARKKFLDKCLAARKNWRGSNFFAEIAETIHMFKHPLQGLEKNLLSFAKDVKSIGHFFRNGSFRTYSKRLGGLWLEYSFGWSPLMEDIKDINKALNGIMDGTYADKQKISATGSHETTLNWMPGQTIAIPFMGGYAFRDGYTKVVNKAKYKGLLKARPENGVNVADSFGFSPGDILPAVWEAIPWSFFIDYFLNVQDQLDSWQFCTGDLGWCERGIRNNSSNITSKFYLNPATTKASGFDVIDVRGGNTVSSTTWFNRQSVTDFPFPPVTFRMPGLDSLKWVNVAALAANMASSAPLKKDRHFSFY